MRPGPGVEHDLPVFASRSTVIAAICRSTNPMAAARASQGALPVARGSSSPAAPGTSSVPSALTADQRYAVHPSHHRAEQIAAADHLGHARVEVEGGEQSGNREVAAPWPCRSGGGQPGDVRSLSSDEVGSGLGSVAAHRVEGSLAGSGLPPVLMLWRSRKHGTYRSGVPGSRANSTCSTGADRRRHRPAWEQILDPLPRRVGQPAVPFHGRTTGLIEFGPAGRR